MVDAPAFFELRDGRSARALAAAGFVAFAGLVLWPPDLRPEASTFGAVLGALGTFVVGLEVPSSRPRRLLYATGAIGLSALSLFDPDAWLGLVAAALLVALLSGVTDAGREHPAVHAASRELWAAVSAGVVLPLLFGSAVFIVGGADARAAVLGAFKPRAWDAFDAGRCAAVGVSIAGLWLGLLRRRGAVRPSELGTMRPDDGEASEPAALRWIAGGLALLAALVAALRLVWVASVATVPSDLLIWSEPPFLNDLLKLRSGVPIYGPMQLVDGYSYSPGFELAGYAVLSPLGLALSLRAYRVLAIACQALSALILFAGFRRIVRSPRSWAVDLTLGGALSALTFSSLLAPFVHPDHALFVCFALALWLVAGGAQSRAATPALLLLPAVAVCFKLTGAGIGLGLVLAFAARRCRRALGLLALAAVLALATIPLFDVTLGEFSRYAIELQASHPIEWSRLRDVPQSAPGRIALFALVLLALGASRRRRDRAFRAAAGVVLVTGGFAALSLLAYLKHGGRDNSLLPLAVGGGFAVLLLGGRHLSTAAALWLAVTASPPRRPLAQADRETIARIEQRATDWVATETRAGHRPLLYSGTLAWIAAGRSDVLHDCLASASELYLGKRPELAAHRARLSDGRYDGIFLTTSALNQNDLLKSLRPLLERDYRVVESSAGPVWPTSDRGYVILARKHPAPAR